MTTRFAPWWAPYWPLDTSVALDTKADWAVYQGPLNDEGLFKTLTSPITDRYLVVCVKQWLAQGGLRY